MNLSKRQEQVQELVALGLTNQEIAERLENGSKTVGTHRDRASALRKGTSLAARELQVAELTPSGLSSADIAPMVGLSVRTVEANRWNLSKKLGVANALQLAALLHTKSSDELYARITELEEQVLQLRAELPGNRLVD